MSPHLSVVIPFRDEAPSLRALYDELAAVLDSLDYESEVIFVDDESRDEGREIIGDLAVDDQRLRLLSISPHAGQSAALEAGFRAARGEIIATLDADLQNAPADLPELIEALDHADCVCGVRVDRRDTVSKRLASRIANSIRRFVLSDGVRDIGCSLRVMRASDLARIRLFRGGHRFIPSLLAMQGARIVELPVRHRPRQHGASKYGIGRRLGVVWVDLLAVFWMKRRTDRYEVKELNRNA
jgi:glycosyltransferase involved in cell wall biosynthesis